MAGNTPMPKEPLFSLKNRKTFTDPLIVNNPITVQILGICSSLAVTTQLKPSLVMGLSVTAVVAGSNLVISLIRHLIPNKIRIIVEMIIIATLVIVVDQVLKAFAFDVSRQLSVFVGLIITNCIVLGRLEAFALTNKPWPSLLDGFGNGIGYALVLVIIGFFRELTSAGKIFGIQVVPAFMYDKLGYTDNLLMVYAPGAFILLGLLVWMQRTVTRQYEED